MKRCPTCGEENADRARFCSNCGASLEAAPLSAAEERKTVSVLFVDLVGFTARSDDADPEDVRATLRVYHDRLREEIERFGGTVEKFIGDAAMAIFGAPVAREDDAERAVRAALRIRGDRGAERRAPGARPGGPRRREHRGGRRGARCSAGARRGASSRATS